MEAEELIRRIEKFVNEMDDYDGEAIITPTMYNPRDLQHDVTFIIMEKVEGGTIPRFSVNVKDLEGIRNLRRIGL